MDSLRSIAMRNVERRKNEIVGAEKIIGEELARLATEQKEQYANEVIRKLGMKLAETREHELATAVSRAGPECSGVLEDLSRALMNKFTAELYKNMREASREGRTDVCEAVVELFGLRDEQ